jgi:hypothetical protein
LILKLQVALVEELDAVDDLAAAGWAEGGAVEGSKAFLADLEPAAQAIVGSV